VQEVKKIVDKLKAENRIEAVSHKKVFRPWGITSPSATGRATRSSASA
jgi:Mannose-6-phosphate isomerase.